MPRRRPPRSGARPSKALPPPWFRRRCNEERPPRRRCTPFDSAHRSTRRSEHKRIGRTESRLHSRRRTRTRAARIPRARRSNTHRSSMRSRLGRRRCRTSWCTLRGCRSRRRRHTPRSSSLVHRRSVAPSNSRPLPHTRFDRAPLGRPPHHGNRDSTHRHAEVPCRSRRRSRVRAPRRTRTTRRRRRSAPQESSVCVPNEPPEGRPSANTWWHAPRFLCVNARAPTLHAKGYRGTSPVPRIEATLKARRRSERSSRPRASAHPRGARCRRSGRRELRGRGPCRRVEAPRRGRGWRARPLRRRRSRDRR